MHPAARLTLIALALASLASSGCGRSLSPTAPTDGHRDGADAAGIEPGRSDAPAAGDMRGRPVGSPPTVTITSPVPSRFFPPVVAPDVTIHWRSEDADGPGPGVKSYRYLIVEEGDPEWENVLVEPESIFALDGWIELDRRSESVQLALTSGKRTVFFLSAIDRHGNADVTVSFDRNALYMFPGFSAPAVVPDDDAGGTRSRRGH